MRAANGILETTTSIAGTLGDGAITLTAIANTPRISSAFGTGATQVRYVIRKGSTGAFETGQGVADTNVLTRTRPMVTWNGSAWADTGTISPLQFGSTPTSGDVTVMLSPLAESTAPVIPARQNSIAGDANWRDYPLSSHCQVASSSGTGGALTAGNEYYAYHRLDVSGSLVGIQFSVSTLVAASNMKLALYAIGSAGLPATKIVDFVTVATATTGLKTDTATGSWTPATGINLTPGWYAIGFINSHSISILGSPPGNNTVSQTPLGRKNAYGYGNTITIAGSYATGLPAVANVAAGSILDCGSTSLSSPWIGLKIT